MRLAADFHIHSHYSRACSPQLKPEYLEHWSKLKGLQVIGTGDCVHPGWLAELKAKLEPAGNGLFRLKEKATLDLPSPSWMATQPLQFLLTTEISSIYKRKGKVRKVHTICVLPSFESADRLHAKLAKIGNLHSDGRPILGLDCRHLAEIVLETDPHAFVIPAHIWTPWFSVLGSKSGFDSLEECFDDLTPEIFAVETGLSSDPAMNRACSFLDRVRLVSNSDAHSPEKLGREANLFDTELSYEGIYNALKRDEGFLGTIEFFPQEGKYHYDGHRACRVSWNPLQTVIHNDRCTACGKPVTKGVMYRVAELADRTRPQEHLGRQKYYSIAPLAELLAECLGQRGAAGKAVREEYHRLVDKLGSEFHILLFAELDEIKRVGGELLALGIDRLRRRDVVAQSGYDGEYGVIKVFRNVERIDLSHPSLFATGDIASANSVGSGTLEFDIREFRRRRQEQLGRAKPDAGATGAASSARFADDQQAAITFGEGTCLVVAGPGAGKTRVLTERIVHLLRERQVNLSQILTVTFSNAAAQEIRSRLSADGVSLDGMAVCTFHALGLSILKERLADVGRRPGCMILDEDGARAALAAATGDKDRAVKALQARISAYKQGIIHETDNDFEQTLQAYDGELRRRNALDLDDLIHLPVQLLGAQPTLLADWRARYRWILVDEYQDINAQQYALLRLLAGDNGNLFVIGDPDQAIYGFRGADVRCISWLQEAYPRLAVMQLKRSYRCPSPVLKGATQALGRDASIEGTAEEIKIHVQTCASADDEADWIAAQIETMIGGVRSLSMHSGSTDGTELADITSFRDFAVLCRTSLLFGPIAAALAQRGIAYQIVGQEPFYRREPAVAVLRALRESQASGQVQSGETVTERLDAIAQALGVGNDERALLRELGEAFGSRVGDFLEALSLRQGIDDYSAKAERVSLMTMHAAKGLEFRAVFIPACEDGWLPFELFGKKSPDELAEEERLLYVAMTRTKRYLYLSHAKQRAWRGRILKQERSSLVSRIEKSLMKQDKRPTRPISDAQRQLSLAFDG